MFLELGAARLAQTSNVSTFTHLPRPEFKYPDFSKPKVLLFKPLIYERSWFSVKRSDFIMFTNISCICVSFSKFCV